MNCRSQTPFNSSNFFDHAINIVHTRDLCSDCFGVCSMLMVCVKLDRKSINNSVIVQNKIL